MIHKGFRVNAIRYVSNLDGLQRMQRQISESFYFISFHLRKATQATGEHFRITFVSFTRSNAVQPVDESVSFQNLRRFSRLLRMLFVSTQNQLSKRPISRPRVGMRGRLTERRPEFLLYRAD
jgi:hypothetical protein